MPLSIDAMRDSRTKKLTACAMLAAVALIFSYVEAIFPLSLGIPGVKLGLANVVIVYTLYRYGEKYALAVNVVRIVLAGLLFGSVFSSLYAFVGGVVSLCAMILAKKAKVFSMSGVSMVGGVFHNFAQLAVAAWVVKTVQLLSYLPPLIFSGIAAGVVNGIIAKLCLDRIK